MGDVKIDPEILKSLGAVQKGFPEEPIPYNPLHPKPFSIQRANEAPRHFDYGMELDLPKKD